MLKQSLRDILARHPALAGETWLECLTLRQEEDILRVGFPHKYFALWFGQHKQALFEEVCKRCFTAGNNPAIVYEHAAPHAPAARHEFQEYRPLNETAASITNGMAQEEEDVFTAFLCNNKNAFPLTAARQIAAGRAGRSYNPFLLCGRSGTGKSQLLRAMAAMLSRIWGKTRVMHADAARFCTENPAWARKPELLWERYQVILLDDIQDITNETAWQNKLIVCMDACPRAVTTSDVGAAPQMVFACSGRPQTLKALDERLRSRLESGLVVELMEPDLDVRLRYLQISCKERGLRLTRDQLLFLAQRCTQFRLLQGLLLKVEAFATVKGCTLTRTDLENIVRTGLVDKTPDCREIINEVAFALNLDPKETLTGKRRPDLVLARQVAMYVCRRKLGLSYPELGRAFGGKDHSTVIHAIKKINKLLVSDKSVRQLVTKVEAKLP